MTEHLWRVESPQFVAGLITDAQGRIRRAAPILRKYDNFAILRLHAEAFGWGLTQLT